MCDLSSRTRDRTCAPASKGGFLTTGPPGKSLLIIFSPQMFWAYVCTHSFLKCIRDEVLWCGRQALGGLVCSSSSGVERPGSRRENGRQAGREEAPGLSPWGEGYPCFPVPRYELVCQACHESHRRKLPTMVPPSPPLRNRGRTPLPASSLEWMGSRWAPVSECL